MATPFDIPPIAAILVGGSAEPVSPVPWLKAQRGLNLIRELDKSVSDWNSPPQFCPTYIQVSPKEIHVIQPDVVPPTVYWGLILADAVHNLRAALDALTWQACHLQGRSPRNPKRVAMPLLRQSRQWDNWERDNSSIPAEVRGRIASLQPFHHPDPDDRLLAAISDLDNISKHRHLLHVPTVPSFEFEAVDPFESEREKPLDSPTIQAQVLPDGSPVPPGQPILRLLLPHPGTMEIENHVPTVLDFAVSHPDGTRPKKFQDLLLQSYVVLASALEYVCNGSPDALEQATACW